MANLIGHPHGSVYENAQVGRDTLPVISKYAASISNPEQKRLEQLANRLAANEPALGLTSVFGPRVKSGLMQGLAMMIGDNREIALADPDRSALFEYRISALAAEGDILLLSGDRNIFFERYRDEFLGLGPLDVIVLPVVSGEESVPLARRCMACPDAIDDVVAKASKSGGLTILPYISTGSIWVLAATIAKRAGVQVRIAAPPPRLSRRVNDKVWFARRVSELLGGHSQPYFRSVYGPAALAGHVNRLARLTDRIVIKVPDSAGSLGNISLGAVDIRGRTLEDLRAYLLAILGGIGWRGRFPLLVEVWDSAVRGSPSVQTWIPELLQGPPVVEGIYEQVVTGSEGEFVGSVPAVLTRHWEERVTHEALLLATLFQHLGYFGRCSFDAIIAGNDDADGALHWIECNGRWGGVSMPMTLANRIVKNLKDRVFVVLQLTNMAFPGRTMAEAIQTIGADLFRTRDSDEGVVLLSPLGLERGTGLNLMAIAKTSERARVLARRAAQQLVGQPV